MSDNTINRFDPKAWCGTWLVSRRLSDKKPNRQEFVRTHPDQTYQVATAVLE